MAAMVIAVLTPAALAQEAPATEPLEAGEISTDTFPDVQVVITAPSSLRDIDLSADQFTVGEDGKPADVSIQPLATKGLDVILAVDTSGSMSGDAIESAQRAAAAFIFTMPPGTQIGVVGFGATPTVAVEPTDDPSESTLAVQSLSSQGETALYDAVVAASQVAPTSPNSHRTLIILSDGGDTVSTATSDEAIAAARASFDSVYAVALATGESNTEILRQLATDEASVVEASKPDALASVYADLADQFRRQYVLNWTSSVDGTGTAEITLANDVGTFSTVRSLTGTQPVAPTAPPTTVATANTVAPASKPYLQGIIAPEGMSRRLLLFGVTCTALALLLAGLLIFEPRARPRRLANEVRMRLPEGRNISGIGIRLVNVIENLLRRDPEKRGRMAMQLERAGIGLSPGEVGAIVLVGTIVAALLGFGLGGLFSAVLMVVVVLLGSFAFLIYKADKRRDTFVAQLEGTLRLMAGSMRSGFGVHQAISTVAQESERPTSDEFNRIVNETRLGRDLLDALEDSANRVNSDDYRWVIEAIDINREVGGNLTEVLDNVIGTIRQRNTLRRQVRTLSAEGRISALVLGGLPVAMFLWMRLSNPEYIGLLTSRSSGRVALMIGVGLMSVGALWLRKIIQIKY